jgi:three-Cys-motif partner protein
VPDDIKASPPKKIPTRVKHFILERYLDAWGGIIIQSCPDVIHLRFVDTFCGAGLYQVEADSTEEPPAYEMGSALLGPVKLLDLVKLGRSKGRQMDAKALLINKEKKELETVKAALPPDVRGEIDVQVRIKRFDEVRTEAIEFCKGSFSFVLIDPYGPTIPYLSVRDIVRGKHTDTLINFPFLTLQRWSGFLAKQAITEDEHNKLELVDAFMGGKEWRELARRSQAKGEPLDELLLSHYVSRLKREGVHAITLPILFENINRPIYHLVFTTHNVAGLSAAKTSFVEAHDHQIKLRDQLEIKRTRQTRLDLFEDRGPSDETRIEAIALLLETEFAGQRAPFPTVVLRGLEECVLEKHVRRALTSLKRQHKASYDKLDWGEVITFVARA